MDEDEDDEEYDEERDVVDDEFCKDCINCIPLDDEINDCKIKLETNDCKMFPPPQRSGFTIGAPKKFYWYSTLPRPRCNHYTKSITKASQLLRITDPME
jgi:hypothetical protein